MSEGLEKHGWGWPVTSDRWHYFRYEHLHALGENGMNSVCGATRDFNGELEDTPEKDAEVCKVCKRMLATGQRRAKTRRMRSYAGRPPTPI